MQKILILSLIITLLSSCSKTDINEENTNSGSVNSAEIVEVELTPEEKKAKKAEEKKEKVNTLRKKLALRGLIIKGDISLKNQEYTSALVKYLQIYKEIPNDQSTIKKLGDVYFNLKKFSKAYSYYSKIKDYDKIDKHTVAKTLIASMPLNHENIIFINNELKTLNLNEEELFYYQNSLSCKIDFSQCKKNFHEYFDKKSLEEKDKEEIKEGSGELVEEKKLEELYNIETAFQNYENFQVDDLLYKSALVSGAFFENGLYPVAIESSKVLLDEKDDYKPLLKLIAKSYFELGDYINAKLYLIKYNKLIKKNDPEASYFLGVVYERLREYILSTIHFKKALKTGYENNIDIKKRILFNYYELGEIEKMLETFKEIIEENKKDLRSDDYSLAIYYHIVNEKSNDAKEIAKEAIERYPESEIFNGYMGWIIMDEINSKAESITETNNSLSNKILEKEILKKKQKIYKEAEEYIAKGLELNPKSPMLNLVKGKLEISKGDYPKAFIYFKKTVSLDNNGDFGKIAKQELENIKADK